MGRDNAARGVVDPEDGQAESIEAGNLVDINRFECNAKCWYGCARKMKTLVPKVLGLC